LASGRDRFRRTPHRLNESHCPAMTLVAVPIWIRPN
jgi:hypothetical protein